LLTRALARVAKFERRTGLSIDRVMVPPHGDCNDVMFEALARTGFDAISWSPKPRSEISGWDVADFGRGGLPSIPRTLLVDRDDLPFRSYLNQPLVLEGHHSDLDEGLTLLEEAAADVNGLGAVTWRSPGGIAETNFSARRVGDCLHVRLFSRRVVLTIPPGVGHMVVDAPRYELQQDDSVAIRPLAGGGAPASGALREELPVIPGTIELRLTRSPVSDGLPSPGGAIWPYVRRLLTESRDRAQPLTDTLHRGRGTATAAAGT
jgi:hypothetical protein